MSLSSVAQNNVQHAWGPELAQFCHQATLPIQQKFTEYTMEQALAYVPREPPRNLEEGILRSIKISEKDVERLYIDYLDHVFPSSYLSVDSFKHYMKSYGFETDEKRLERYFKSFNTHNNGSLSFHEFLIGLAMMEPISQHGELRTKFIFRYYSATLEHLSKEDLIHMIADIYPKESKTEQEKNLSLALNNLQVKHVNGKEMVSLEDFSMGIGSHKLRGTSKLCRASKAIFPQISRSIAERIMMSSMKTSPSEIVFNRTYQGKH